MNTEAIINFIELFSVFIGTCLGVAATLTKTKNNNGRLTKWGIVAIIGIILTNSFSFIQKYLKQKQDALNKITAMENARDKEKAEKEKYVQQMKLLFANINKSDSSLKQQFNIQKQTSKLLSQFDTSIHLQNDIFKQSKILTIEQQNAMLDINRTLNPLVPLSVQLLFSVSVDTSVVDMGGLNYYEFNLSQFTKQLIKDFKNNEPGVYHDYDDFRRDIIITPDYKYKDFIISLFSNSYVVVSFTPFETYKMQVQHKFAYAFQSFTFNVNPNFDQYWIDSSNSLIDVSFDRRKNRFTFLFNNYPVRIENNTTFSSSNDIEHSIVELYFDDMKCKIDTVKLAINLPPNNSRKFSIEPITYESLLHNVSSGELRYKFEGDCEFRRYDDLLFNYMR